MIADFVFQHVYEWAEDYRPRTRMGFYAERRHKAQEHSRKLTRTSVQFWGLHDALHVCIHNHFAVVFGVRSLIFFFRFEFWIQVNGVFFFSSISQINGVILCCRTIYNMCTQKPPHDYSQQLYDKYREAFEEYIISTVSNNFLACHIPPFKCLNKLLQIVSY